MKTKKYRTWVLVSVASLLVIAAYQAGKFAGENLAESRVREKELAFQKEKEATRKAEFAQLLRINEEEKQAAEKQAAEKQAAEKQAAEKRRREEKEEERVKEAIERRDESIDKHLETSIQSSWYSRLTTKTPQKGLISAIVYSEDNPSAVIGDSMVHEGDTVGSVTVVKIHKDKIEFEKKGKDTTVKWTQKIGEAPKAHWE